MYHFKFEVNKQIFFSEFYEKKYYLLKNGAHVENFTWPLLDSALFSWSPDDGSMLLYKNGRVDSQEYVETFLDITTQRQRVIKDALYKNLKSGATLVLNKINNHIAEINDLCKELSQFVGVKTNANGYVAFGGDGSFGKHWDTHDVFAVQLIGKKLWRIYAPTFENPLPHQGSKEFVDECPSVPEIEIVLDEGDVLYLPRGWWHEALPIEGEESFHITVGLFPAKVMDYLIWACGKYLPLDKCGREMLHEGVDSTAVLKIFAERVSSILTQEGTLDEFFSLIRENERMGSRFHISDISRQHSAEEKVFTHVTINSSRNTPTAGGFIIANGIKLKLDAATEQLITELIVLDRSTESSDLMVKKVLSSTEENILKKLSELDVIEVY